MEQMPKKQKLVCSTGDYAVQKKGQTPDEMMSVIVQRLEALYQLDDRNTLDTIQKQRNRSIANAIWGSDNIESEGLKSKSETVQLCLQMWPENDIDIRYLNVTEQSTTLCMKSSQEQEGWQETVQHIKAFAFAYHQLVAKRQPLSIPIILETHKVLLLGDTENMPGQFRDGPCYGFGNDNFEFAEPRTIPETLQGIVNHYNTIQELEIDVFVAVARFSVDYIALHPMFDGNGRMSRILMNCLVLRYLPFCAALGGDSTARTRYLHSMKVGVQMGMGAACLAYEILAATYGEAMASSS